MGGISGFLHAVLFQQRFRDTHESASFYPALRTVLFVRAQRELEIPRGATTLASISMVFDRGWNVHAVAQREGARIKSSSSALCQFCATRARDESLRSSLNYVRLLGGGGDREFLT